MPTGRRLNQWLHRASHHMDALTIRLSKKPDGSVVFSCTRPDGSTTWQKHQRHAEFFPLHDLSHLAVETTLGLRSGFYGLLARGWNITDFGNRTIPADAAYEAALAEAVVGLLDGERAVGQPYGTAEFNRALATSLGHAEQTLEWHVTDEDLDAIRSAWLSLAGQWARVAVGEDLILVFEPQPAGAV